MFIHSHELFCQNNNDMQEFGITAGGFTNFPANQKSMKEDINVLYIAPYIRTGQHEFSAGILYPLTTHGLFFNDNSLATRYIWNNLSTHVGFNFKIGSLKKKAKT